MKTYEQTNDELRTNTMNTTTGIQTIRSNIFARSCNDDFCPAMEDLCVKMSKLSLQSDPKMDAYDAKLEQFFYEEKDEMDEKNEETFRSNDDTEYSLEVCAFNTRYRTNFTTKKLAIFLDYVDNTGLTIDDALQYMQGCHTCGDQLEEFGSEYCNDHCRDEFGEGPHRECFHGNSCLICYGYPETTCYWAQKGCDRCDAYDGPEEDRYPNSCVNCLTQMTDHEGYIVHDELYCNNCAVDIFDNHDVEDPVNTICYWMPNCPDCLAYSGNWNDRYPYSCFNCDKPMTDHEGYWENSTIHCNVCAEDLFGLTGHKEQHEDDSKKRSRDPESDDEESDSKRQRVNEKLQSQMSALTDESCDIWDLALDITQSVTAALQLIEDQPRLRAHPRVIEYYRAKAEDMDFEECSSECSADSDQDDDLHHRKRARHILFEDIDEDEDNECPEVMVIDLLDEPEEEEDYGNDYDYAESVVDDDSEVENLEDAAPNTVTMAQTTVSSMVTMIQELQEENASLRAELELLQSQRRMLFPEGSSISITDDDGERYINIHAQAPSRGRGLSMSDLECGFMEDAMEIDQEPLRVTRLVANSLPNTHSNMYGSYDDLQGSDNHLGGCSYNHHSTRR